MISTIMNFSIFLNVLYGTADVREAVIELIDANSWSELRECLLELECVGSHRKKRCWSI